MRAIVITAMLLAVALGALVAARIARQEPTAEVRAAPTPRPKAERTSTADPRGFVGVIFPRKQVDLAADVSARVMDVKVQLGTPLKKGDVVASLDADSLRRELSAAQAAARAARVASSAARERAERYAKHSEAISGDELTSSASESKVSAARAAEASARVEQLRVLVERAAIVAPFDGVVAARYVDPGALVTPGQPIARLISGDDLWVRFAIPEEQAGAVKVKSCVEVSVEAQEVPARGLVEMVAPQVDTELRMLVVEAQLQLPDAWKQGLQAGLAARVQPAPCITP
ncbi:MAG TPA: efflux RND transporter periplasmic adaptor subunit [Kofleriaceae bacterium]|nr:efflux RND transporter periplasmic adaptor subunit [Kofleriaceae bacterium]